MKNIEINHSTSLDPYITHAHSQQVIYWGYVLPFFLVLDFFVALQVSEHQNNNGLLVRADSVIILLYYFRLFCLIFPSNQSVCFDLFTTMGAIGSRAITEEEAQNAFNEIDVNKDGSVSSSELKVVFFFFFSL